MRITADIRVTFTKTNRVAFEVKQISEWRKGFCLCEDLMPQWHNRKYSWVTGRRVFIVGRDMHAVFYQDSDPEIDDFPIIRAWGGFYVSYICDRYNFRTFPGQDRDTEYSVRSVIGDIITEDGIVLRQEQKKEFLLLHEIKYSIELGDNIILCENSLYRLDDYSLISNIPKGLITDGKFDNGKVKAYNTNDYKNFYVVVHKEDIIRTVGEEDFIDMVNITKSNILTKKGKMKKEKNIKGIDSTQIDKPCLIDPQYIAIIKNYLYGFPPKYRCLSSNFPHLFDGAPRLWHDFTGYFKEKGKWYKINEDKLIENIKEMQSKHYPLPNFITKITFIDSIIYRNLHCKLYFFECKPYGYITSKGEFLYDFDINNIKW